MADENHLKLVFEGVEVLNEWRKENPRIRIDLSGANLEKVNLRGVNLSEAKLNGADLRYADLSEADFRKANLRNAFLLEANLGSSDLTKADLRKAHLYKAELDSALFINANLSYADFSDTECMSTVFTGANLSQAYAQKTNFTWADFTGANLFAANFLYANFTQANLCKTDLSGAILIRAILSEADLSGANLYGADLTEASAVRTNFDNAILTYCRIYGLSAWELQGTPKDQSNLVITHEEEPEITVDHLQVAQFIYLLLNNRNVRNVIDTITSKAVLILGRFTDERKAVLDALHTELRQRNYLPILFDFSGPQNRDITETVSTLAHMARFIVADITDAKSIPQELQAIVPHLPSVPVQPILLASQREYGMFEHFKRYPWVLPTYYYHDIQEAVMLLPEKILNPLEAKFQEQTSK